MDLNMKTVQYSLDTVQRKGDHFGNTELCLNGFGYGGSAPNGHTESNLRLKLSSSSDEGCLLGLGLGPTPLAYCDDYCNIQVKKKDLATSLTPCFPSDCDSILQLGLSGGAHEGSSVIDDSGSSETEISRSCFSSQAPSENIHLIIPVVDEDSTSAKRSNNYIPSLLWAPRMENAKFSVQTQEPLVLGTKLQLAHELSIATNDSMDTSSEPASAAVSSEHRTSNPRICKFLGCSKGARGASGLCIGHGGGQRCQKPGCNKGAEGRTAFCKAHGGGKRCQHLGCTKSAEGKTDFCIAHGGGKRCVYDGGCNKAARGKSGLCIRHGGGKRCNVEGCARSAEGQAGLCISHGGGRRCQYQGCSKGAQGSTMFCKAHGGGKRCIIAGCTKGAEGSTPLCKGHGGGKRCLFNGGGICPKSVHGGTNFCVAHGGGKRCSVPGCTKSARGRTDCCVRHGGGKRCKFENCGKSAQGSTDFCKAHGGGKRCCWNSEKTCEDFARGESLCAAPSILMQDHPTNKGRLIAPGLFHGLLAATSTPASSLNNNSSATSVASDCIDSLEKQAKRPHLIPEHVLFPLSMKSSSFPGSVTSEKLDEGRSNFGAAGTSSRSRNNLNFSLPEGRVHGGDLMLFLGGNL